MRIKTNALFWFRGPYFKPSPLKCWTINRTISWSVWHMGFRGGDLIWKSPFANVEQEPFCWDDVATLDSPLCWGQPFDCMVVAETRCFLRGGGEVPPSSDSDDDASIAQLHSIGKTLQKSHPFGPGQAKLEEWYPPTLTAVTKFVLLDDVTGWELWEI